MTAGSCNATSTTPLRLPRSSQVRSGWGPWPQPSKGSAAQRCRRLAAAAAATCDARRLPCPGLIAALGTIAALPAALWAYLVLGLGRQRLCLLGRWCVRRSSRPPRSGRPSAALPLVVLL